MRPLYSLMITFVLVLSQSTSAIANSEASVSESTISPPEPTQSEAPSTVANFPSSETATDGTPSSETAALTPTPLTQQTGVIQFNNSGLSALTYPNCSGACVFAIGRMAPTGNNSSTWEAVTGVVWQISSPENTQAQAVKMRMQAERDRMAHQETVELAEKLARAIEEGKQERANLFAMILAERLGYSNHLQLIAEIKRDRKLAMP